MKDLKEYTDASNKLVNDIRTKMWLPYKRVKKRVHEIYKLIPDNCSVNDVLLINVIKSRYPKQYKKDIESQRKYKIQVEKMDIGVNEWIEKIKQRIIKTSK